jgi:hypothetical protein
MPDMRRTNFVLVGQPGSVLLLPGREDQLVARPALLAIPPCLLQHSILLHHGGKLGGVGVLPRRIQRLQGRIHRIALIQHRGKGPQQALLILLQRDEGLIGQQGWQVQGERQRGTGRNRPHNVKRHPTGRRHGNAGGKRLGRLHRVLDRPALRLQREIVLRAAIRVRGPGNHQLHAGGHHGSEGERRSTRNTLRGWYRGKGCRYSNCMARLQGVRRQGRQHAIQGYRSLAGERDRRLRGVLGQHLVEGLARVRKRGGERTNSSAAQHGAGARHSIAGRARAHGRHRQRHGIESRMKKHSRAGDRHRPAAVRRDRRSQSQRGRGCRRSDRGQEVPGSQG